jgi:nucleotide-binding universal stress UspA family protein
LVPDGWNSLALNMVALAWDFSLAASRALRSALPLLSAAGNIRVFTIANEKESTRGRGIDDLRRHLAEHKIAFTFDTVDIAGRSIGEAFRAHTQSIGADMLVMGAFGHSRVREFVLGGATQNMLSEADLPVLFVH